MACIWGTHWHGFTPGFCIVVLGVGHVGHTATLYQGVLWWWSQIFSDEFAWFSVILHLGFRCFFYPQKSPKQHILKANEKHHGFPAGTMRDCIQTTRSKAGLTRRFAPCWLTGWRCFEPLGICNPQFKIEVGDELLISIVYIYMCVFLFWISTYNFVVWSFCYTWDIYIYTNSIFLVERKSKITQVYRLKSNMEPQKHMVFGGGVLR